MFSQCVVCCFLQVSKREITESGWVRPTDVSSGEPVWLRQQPQLSLPSLSDRLCPRSAAPVIVSSHSRPPLSSPSISLLPLFPSVCVLLFYAFHPLPFCEVPALISLMSASLYLLSFWFVLFWCGWLCFCPLKSSGWDPFQPEVPLPLLVLVLLLHKLTELKWPERMPVGSVARRQAITL